MQLSVEMEEQELDKRIFEWIEFWCNPYGRYTRHGILSSSEYERRYHDGGTPAE
jgi:hypothetical protein